MWRFVFVVVLGTLLSTGKGEVPPCLPPLPEDSVAEAIMEDNSGVRMLLIVTSILLSAGVGLLAVVVARRR